MLPREDFLKEFSHFLKEANIFLENSFDSLKFLKGDSWKPFHNNTPRAMTLSASSTLQEDRKFIFYNKLLGLSHERQQCCLWGIQRGLTRLLLPSFAFFPQSDFSCKFYYEFNLLQWKSYHFHLRWCPWHFTFPLVRSLCITIYREIIVKAHRKILTFNFILCERCCFMLQTLKGKNSH